MAAVAAAALSAITNKGVRLSHDLQELALPRVNVVHVQRPEAAVPGDPKRLVSKPAMQVVINVTQPDAAVEHLLSAVQLSALQQQLHADLHQAVQLMSSTLQLDHVHAKLQVITQQSCPNWHADSVGMRMLCSYAGPGTWFIANRFVRRHYDPWSGDVSIAGVDDAHALQAAAGDLLFLKGNGFPGLHGAGAVHKSPELQGESRLLLTVDDACC